MRVIAGKYGGRKLVAFKASHIRPTTDRIKEVIFNKLQFTIDEAQVLDLFSGTGNLAFEALSRGASSVVAVEMSQASVRVIEKNMSSLGVGEELQIIQSDVYKFLRKPVGEPFDIIFVDPPFTKKMASEVLLAISKSNVYHQNTDLFIESTAQESVLDEYGPMHLKKRQSYGDKFLSHYVFS